MQHALLESTPRLPDWWNAALTRTDIKPKEDRALTQDAERPAELTGATTQASRDEVPASDPIVALLTVFTNGVADDRIKKAALLPTNDTLTANEKLLKIDALIRFPATASAEKLGRLLGLKKQPVSKTDWWHHKRKGN